MKISIIGAGNVGSTTALRILEADLADVVLFDIAKGLAEGKALDLLDSNAVRNIDKKVCGTSNYVDLKNSDIVIITAGFARKSGMTRDDLLRANADIVKDISLHLKSVCNDSIVIVVTNPLDIMTYVVKTVTGFSPFKVFGMAGELDSARLRAVLKDATGLPYTKIEANVLGGHAPELMVPHTDEIKVDKRLIADSMKKESIDDLFEKTRQRGTEIVDLLATGSAYYGPSSAVFKIVKTIIMDKKEACICSIYLSGQYGLQDLCIGVPAILGKNGIEKIIELDLNDNELTALKRAATAIKENIKKINL